MNSIEVNSQKANTPLIHNKINNTQVKTKLFQSGEDFKIGNDP
jgi:hypothetical protein